MTVKLPDKPRKHRYVTEAITSGESAVTVWPSPDDLKTPAKRKSFMETIAKVGNDPRVVRIEKYPHDIKHVVFLFHIKDA